MRPRNTNSPPARETRGKKKIESEEPDDIAIEFPGPTPEFADARQFAKAIAEKCNLVGIGSALLQGKETKSASVRARMFETTLEYLYGKPAAAQTPEPPPVRIILDMPAPDREKISE